MREPVQSEITLRSGDRARVLGWPAEGSRGAVLVHHGLGEHIGRYQTVADLLPGRSIWGYDIRGHGPLTPKRGHADGLEAYALDFAAAIPTLLDRAGADHAVVLAQSMGAACILTAMTRGLLPPSIRGAILMAAPVAVELDRLQRMKVRFGRGLARIAPAFTLESGLPADGISSVPQMVQRYQADPLVHGRISLALARSVVDDPPALIDAASRVTLPTLLLHGADDPIARSSGSERLAAAIKGSRLEVFPGAMHEVHHERPGAVARWTLVVGEFLDTHLG